MMAICIETNCTIKTNAVGPHNPRNISTKADTHKKKWLQKYSRQLLGVWLQRQTPLGIAWAYIEQIKVDLGEFYEDPLKRMFIETTYN